jgi:hypothetical protein
MKPLKQQALEHLERHKGLWSRISRETGLGYGWINRLSQGKIVDPGAAKLEKLLEWKP